MLSPPGAPALRSVHSLKQRMVWYEAEKGIFIHAVRPPSPSLGPLLTSPFQSIELPRAPRHTREGSSATISSVSGATMGSGMNDASLLSSLECAYRMYKLHHGSILGPLQERGKEQVVRTLSVFWEDWVRKWEVERVGGAFERVVGGTYARSGSPAHTDWECRSQGITPTDEGSGDASGAVVGAVPGDESWCHPHPSPQFGRATPPRPLDIIHSYHG